MSTTESSMPDLASTRAVFVSDVHLTTPDRKNYRRMLALLDTLSGVPDLFILGDFFDFWFGFDRVVPAHYVPVLSALERTARAGTRIHFVEGNHDFEMGDYFTRTLGAVVHPEWGEATLDGRRLFLGHGDTIDRNDTGYLRLRRVLRSAPVRWLGHNLPPKAILWVADRLDQATASGSGYASHLPDLFRDFARARWAEGYDGVLLGHCHVPEYTEEAVDGRTCFYANLGDWVANYTYLTWDGEGFTLRRFD